MKEGRSVWEQYDAQQNKVLPYHLDSTKGNAQRVSGTPHSWSDGQAAWYHGRMGDWIKYKQPQSMGYYKKQELEYQFALADAFTICDAYHCAMHAGTNPNRKFIWTGTNGPTGAGVASVLNEFDGLGPSSEGYEWSTYPERLQQAGVSWKVYQNMPDNFTDNPLAGFKQYRRANEQSGQPVSHSDLKSPAYDARIDANQPLYKGIANTMPDGGFLGSFKEDIQQGQLPQVSWIVAPATYSEHPGPSSPVQGAWYIQEVLNALTENPHIWSQTVLLVNFDENDGFFDHIPSPSAPSKDQTGQLQGKTTLTEQQLSYEYFNHPAVAGSKSQPKPDGRVYGPGVRVPLYILSPWSRGGWVNSQVFDHTSILRFLEQRFGIQEPNISPYRRAVCGDLTSAFNFKTPNLDILPELPGQKSRQEADAIRLRQALLPQLTVPKNQNMPLQQTGIRLSRALPYILHCSAKVELARQQVQLIFSNTGEQAAVFHVYDKLDLEAIPRRYMVEAGKQLDDIWSVHDGRYDLWVMGPNGFHRSFQGNLHSKLYSESLPEIRICVEECEPKIYLKLRSEGQKTVKLVIQANAYLNKSWHIETRAAETELLLDMNEWYGWYDFTVSLENEPEFKRRFAGRIETGKDSYSDPFMGYSV